MTVEERMTKIEENMILQGELVARLERKADQFIDSTEKRFVQVESEMAEFRTGLNAVLERMDRFIQGQEGNGQR